MVPPPPTQLAGLLAIPQTAVCPFFVGALLELLMFLNLEKKIMVEKTY
jgi:hypothetical protein